MLEKIEWGKEIEETEGARTSDLYEGRIQMMQC